MEVHNDAMVPVESKYCKRCGELWVLSQDEEEVYCPACVPRWRNFLRPCASRGWWSLR